MTEFDRKTYGDADHAKTHRRLEPGKDRDTPEIAADFETLMRDGYVIIKNLIPVETCEYIKRDSLKLLGETGRNSFEGRDTQRVYNVLGKTDALDELATHPHILGLMDRFFQPSFLLSQSQIINIQPGESAQGLHHDDSFYRIPRPRQPLGAATIWAIDEFTETNGATVVIPGSHEWGEGRTGKRSEAIPAVMPQGSVIFFLGTTWHGGGENRSDKARFAVTHQYCESYVRQQENYLLELSKERVRAMSPELQSLVGYSIFPPFMGMVNGMHPLRTLQDA
ncbi:phytanoyl-CoA dioxygenase family protein [Ponticaulis sp.]|uniref:phytanoyl-CoA dioxygenase family protein n=1 Tax=Ponticaulis sp. TaxID=2020902 RepID=UPI000B6E2CDB|nr:phytanoyl-CoA dioxygenase family protein [Ponticaulis sp.]MAI89324.1 phytanoyl-CoA dioxygenase [Ponticaulis sp.]OUY01304.1 MAG: phytanoyl-CoA dioxygenase [Hyphomonadaceae bacterium TMED5]|tara:strand:- start:53837 stop:54676 length:840 start_codon:yes stop_codon:yes gene_type:complete